jgi:phosphatidylglycerol:prolipoprotein diacylglycerol transferase
MIPVIFEIGPFPLNSFGLMMVCCFLAAWRRLYLSLEQAGEDPAIAEPMIVTAALSGIIGSRINYLITYFDEFLADPLGAIFSGAGFVFYGGFFLAMFSLYLFLKKLGKNFLAYADLAAPALALGYAVGRIGCHLSGDGDYGKTTDSLLGFSYALGAAPTPRGVFVHPTPIYESIAGIALAYLLVWLQRKQLLGQTGALFGFYLMVSAVFRFLVEFVRVEPEYLLFLTEAQVAGIFAFLLGLFFMARGRSFAR